MFPKKRIRLSRNLHAQTTPYPNARKWLKPFLILLILGMVASAYALIKTPKHETKQSNNLVPKEILGEQTNSNKEPHYETHVVSPGDTLFNISKRYNISWQTLAQINNLDEPYTLKIGQKLQILQYPVK